MTSSLFFDRETTRKDGITAAVILIYCPVEVCCCSRDNLGIAAAAPHPVIHGFPSNFIVAILPFFIVLSLVCYC